MNLQCGIVEESYKYVAGEYNSENDKKYVGFRDIPGREPASKYPIKWGKDIFAQKSIRVVTGKRGWVAFQIALKADEEFTVGISDNPHFSVYGELNHIRIEPRLEMKQANIIMNNVGMIEDDDGTFKSDILLNNEVVKADKRRTQLVWVEVEIPASVDAGVYKGQIDIYMHKMFEAEKKMETLSFIIDVRNVLMPEPSEYKFHLDLWQHNSNIARKHEVVLWSDEHFKVLERYIASLANLGQKVVTVIASEIPWSGQRCITDTAYPSDLFEYSMIHVKKDSDGAYIYNFDTMQRYIDLCSKYGIDSEIEVFGLVGIWAHIDFGYGTVAADYPDAVRIRYYDCKDSCYKFVNKAEDIKKYITAIEQYFIQNNLIEKVRIIADEPADMELYRQRLDILKEVAPSFKYKTAINHASFIGEFREQVSDFVPGMGCVSSEWDLICDMKKKTDAKFHWYVCCGPNYPNTFIRSHLLESRFIGYLTSYMNFDGFLRWNYTVWPEKPREKLRYKSPNWKAGDMNFVYPSNDGRPILTVRYKNLKRGIEEFELIRILKEKHPNADIILEGIWDKVIKIRDVRKFYEAKGMEAGDILNLEHDDYEDVRRRIFDEIENQAV